MLGPNRAALRVLRAIILFEFFILLTSSQICLRAQGPSPGVYTKALSDSTQRVVFDSGAFSGPSTASPQWGNSYLVSRDVETFQAGVVNVRLYDQSGKKVREAAIWFPDSLRVLIYSATATSDGRIIAAGKAEKADGTAGPFVALTDLGGKITNVIQTNGFFPANICQAPDGTVWSFGGTGYDENSQPRLGDTLRQFDFRKGQVGSYLSRSTFPKRPGPETLAYIQCLSDELVAYSSKGQQYIEMKYAGDTPHLYNAEVPSGLRIGGFAVIGSKIVYGYFFGSGKGG